MDGAEFKSKTKLIVGFKSKTSFFSTSVQSESTSAFTLNSTKKAFFKFRLQNTAVKPSKCVTSNN